jgi:hypothetical protein
MKNIISISAEIKELIHLIKKGKALNLQFPTDKILAQSIYQHELRLKELRKILRQLKKQEALSQAA